MTDESALRATTAIAGSPSPNLGEVGAGVSALDLIGRATTAASADAGLDRADICAASAAAGR
ncbi:hypothetical protein WEH80_18555 [Actinomycetes bacterium KLBMP 9759]